MSPIIQIVLADDHILFTDLLTSFLEKEPDLKIIAVAPDGSKLIEAVAIKRPDVVLTDVAMPGTDGVAAVKILKERYPNIRVLVLSSYNSTGLINNMKAIGAHGFVTKNAPVETLVTAIRTVAAGGNYFENGEKKPLSLSRKNDLLSRRETEVLELIAEGKTSAVIASQLNITKDTVESHRKNMLRKLNLSGKTELLRYALSYIQDYNGYE